MEELGYGGLELTPQELWSTTPAEFLALTRGYEWRMDQERRRTAWWLSHVLNAWTDKKHRVTPEQLYPGRKRDDTR